ncbi:MAG: fibronectin type III domain-containing protein [Candidatus Kapaibacterium sp.]
MNQRDKISNSFSDAYLAAMLEGVDTAEVIRQFSKDFPELTLAFETNAKSLDLLYGDLRSAEMPSENEISAAYKKVSERFATAVAPVVAVKPGLFAQIKAVFAASPTWAGSSLAIGAAVIIALLWQPWVIKESLKETAKNNQTPAHVSEKPQAPPDLASNDQTANDPTKMPEAQYRGANQSQKMTATERRHQDSIDAVRLKQMTTPKALSAPTNLRIEAGAQGSVLVHWDAVPDALSYIVEVKGANDEKFQPVTQVSQTNLRVTLLQSGMTYFVRVTAASGERKGLPSDAKSIIVP